MPFVRERRGCRQMRSSACGTDVDGRRQRGFASPSRRVHAGLQEFGWAVARREGAETCQLLRPMQRSKLAWQEQHHCRMKDAERLLARPLSRGGPSTYPGPLTMGRFI